MTKDEQNIAIAESLRAKPCPYHRCHHFRVSELTRHECTPLIPDFCGSLDAMAQAEREGLHNTPASSSPFSYASHLEALCRATCTEIWHATAAQRAEAFLRTKSLWTE